MAVERITQLNFGEPEAELDGEALERSFYESEGWSRINQGPRTPFVIGRKGAGKSAIAMRLGVVSRNEGTPYVSIVPADFRHVEIRQLLSHLVDTSTSWQYIYHEVWEGLILGQIVRFLTAQENIRLSYRLSTPLRLEIATFDLKCALYTHAMDDALVDVMAEYLHGRVGKDDPLTIVELRRLVQPYKWRSLIDTLGSEDMPRITVCIDGLDDYWDSSDASLSFLAQGLEVVKSMSGKLQRVVRFVVCLRDSIFRALVDTNCVEYDKLEPLILDLKWTTRTLLELIALRAFPDLDASSGLAQLRALLPSSVDSCGLEEYLGQHILRRPRDYINFFRLLQAKCFNDERVSESQLRDVMGDYCGNRLTDLEKEFGFTYPGITRVISELGGLPVVFDKTTLLERLDRVCRDLSTRGAAQELMLNYGDPNRLARILLSLGVIGVYEEEDRSLRFVQEFSESRVIMLFSRSERLGLHPVYRYTVTGRTVVGSGLEEEAVGVLDSPSDYLPETDHVRDLIAIEERMAERRRELVAELNSIDKGREHARRFEKWVKTAMEVIFVGDLVDSEDQVIAQEGRKRFELIFRIASDDSPWAEIKDKYKTHRLLVECKNTEEPSDADVSKLGRDMESLGLDESCLVYRNTQREPSGKLVKAIRSRYQNSGKSRVIIAVTEGFLRGCLAKSTVQKCRKNLDSLWRLHVERLLPI